MSLQELVSELFAACTLRRSFRKKWVVQGFAQDRFENTSPGCQPASGIVLLASTSEVTYQAVHHHVARSRIKPDYVLGTHAGRHYRDICNAADIKCDRAL